MHNDELTSENVNGMWAQALEYWGTSIQISQPVNLATLNNTDQENQSIAYINMQSRQVVYNENWFVKNKVTRSLSAAFAHELGHHLKFPATLKTSAELLLLGEKYIPGLPFYHLNIFWDLLVNEFVGRDPHFREQLKEIYLVTAGEKISNYYKRYLGIYEALWRCEGFFQLELDSTAKAGNQDFAETFYQLPNFYEQFLYFLSHFIVLFPIDELLAEELYYDPFSGDSGTPGADDFPTDRTEPGALKKALKKASEKKWLNEKSTAADDIKSAWKKISDVMSRLPGKQSNQELQKATYLFYRNQVEKLILLMPKQIKGDLPENSIPSTHADWDSGDDVQSIDWVGSYLKAGAYAPAFLLKRELIQDDSVEQVGYFKPKIEIYLDTSGSMPSPMQDINTMTLAALLLATYAIRKHGTARGTVYSVEKIDSKWMASEARAQEFFLKYFGGGTVFPFEKLESCCREEAKAHRVIISDSDFIYNVKSKSKQTLPILKTAVDRSLSTTFLLHGVHSDHFEEAVGTDLARRSKCNFISVTSLDHFVPMAAALATALFGELL